MNENNEIHKPAACCSEDFKEGSLVFHCPMMTKFDETIGNPKLVLFLSIIGIALLILGVAIILEPKIVAWIIALVLMLVGVSLLMMVYYINRMKSPIEH